MTIASSPSYNGLCFSACFALSAVGCATSGSREPATEPIYVFEQLSESEVAAVRYPELRKELLDMVERDQRARAGVQAANHENNHTEALIILTEIDKENTARLREIVDKVGWPTISAVGSDAAQAAWLLA